MKLWITGGDPDIQLVFLIKWSKISGDRVKGFIEVYNRDAAGNPNLLQSEVLFNLIYALTFQPIDLFAD